MTPIYGKNRIEKEEDLTGLRRMPWNVLSSWGGYLVYVVAGFVMPRIIDRQIGQSALGIWDFSWSIVSYFSLTGLGIGSSIHRYVAKYRAVKDIEKLRVMTSSAMYIQIIIAFAVVFLSIGAFLLLPFLFGDRLGADIGVAKWVVGLLGLSLAVQMAFSPYEGIIKGCHRWDLHNGLNSGSYGVTVVGMIATLSLGGGLKSLSLIYLCAIAITEVGRAVIAKKVCPELRIRLGDAQVCEGLEMFKFGGKTFIAGLSPLVLTQGVSILIAAHLGPAALAVFARPSALVRHAQVFVDKLAFVLTPITSSLQGSAQLDKIRQLFIIASRYAVSISLPATIFFLVLGDKILRIWMGPQYEHGSLLAILAIGYFLPTVQQVGMTIMTGLNKHGKIGFLSLTISVCGLVLGISISGILGWDLHRGALVVAIPLTLGNGFMILLITCRRLHVPIKEYIRESFWGPVLCGLPFALWLIACRIVFNERPVAAVIFGLGVGALILLPLYWRYILTEENRKKIIGSLRIYDSGRVPKKEII